MARRIQLGAAGRQRGIAQFEAVGSANVTREGGRLARLAGFAEVNAVAIVDEALEGANRNRGIDLAAPECLLARRAEHDANGGG